MFSLISIWKYLLLVCLVISFLQVESNFNIALFGEKKKTKNKKQKKTSINVFLSRVFIMCWKVLSENGLWLNRTAVQFWTWGWWENLSLYVMQHSSSNCKTFGPLLANDRLKSPIKPYVFPPVASAPQFQAVVLKHQGCSGVRRVTTLPHRVNLLENNKKYALLRLYV